MATTVTTDVSSLLTDMTSLTTEVTETITENIYNTTTHIFDTFSVPIHPHWYGFPTVSDEWHYIIGVYITIVGFTGIAGNSLVIWIFTRTRSLRTPSNMYLVNLAISDLTFSVVNGFPLLSLSAFNKKWIFGSIACQFYGLIGGIFGLMSINTLAAIAVDRYYAIAKPLKIAKIASKKRSFLTIVVVWLWSLAWSVPPIFGWGAYIPEGFQTSCTFDYLTRTDNNRTYIFCLYIFGFVVPLLIILAAYVLIIKAVRKHGKNMKKTAKKLNAEMRSNQDKQKMEVRLAKIAFIIVTLFLLSWTPYAIVALIGQFGDAALVTPFLSEIPVMFAKAAAMHNPIVYALSHPKFRQALHEQVPWLMCCCPPPPKTQATSDTYRDRSKRSLSSMNSNPVGGSVSELSSAVSNMSDVPGDNALEMRLKELEEPNIHNNVPNNIGEKETTFARRRRERDDDVSSNKIIQDLVQALVGVASAQRQAPTPQVPIYLNTGSADVKTNESGKRDDNVFMLDPSALPNLASYLTQLSARTSGGAMGGISNPALDTKDEIKPPAESSPIAGSPIKDAESAPKKSAGQPPAGDVSL